MMSAFTYWNQSIIITIKILYKEFSKNFWALKHMALPILVKWVEFVNFLILFLYVSTKTKSAPIKSFSRDLSLLTNFIFLFFNFSESDLSLQIMKNFIYRFYFYDICNKSFNNKLIFNFKRI